MSRKLRQHPEPETAIWAIQEAIAKIKDARTKLRYAGAKKAADYLQRALKSAEGAQRHAERIAHQPQRSEP